MKALFKLMLFFTIMSLMIVSAHAEKTCPIDGEVFPDKFNFCITHGVELESKSDRPSKIYVLSKDGKTEVMKFTGFNTNCDGYGEEGVKYAEQGFAITIPWKEIKYILPEHGAGLKLKSGVNYEFKSDNIKATSCKGAYLSEEREEKVMVLGEELTRINETKIEIKDVKAIAFSESGLKEGKRKIDTIKEEVKREEIKNGISDAEEAMKGKDYSKAIKAYEEVLKIDGNNSDAIAGLKKAKAKAKEVADKYPNMAYVKGGCYEMGCGSWTSNCDSDEHPAHEVCVDDFYMDKYEVTQKEYKKVMGETPARFKGENNPVEKVNWNEANNYCRKTGKRLPTEAEWEYAARSRGKEEKWAGTSIESKLGEYAWYSSNSGSKTHPVGQKQPNGLGLYDMSGNVWEWVADWYDSDYYKSSIRNNPKGPSSGGSRVLRGGSWGIDPVGHARCGSLRGRSWQPGQRPRCPVRQNLLVLHFGFLHFYPL